MIGNTDDALNAWMNDEGDDMISRRSSKPTGPHNPGIYHGIPLLSWPKKAVIYLKTRMILLLITVRNAKGELCSFV